jgi:hypothetical protein
MLLLNRPLSSLLTPRRLGARVSLRLALLGAALLPATEGVASVTPLFDALTKGKFTGSARYRYEIYEQDSVPGATTVAGGLTTGTARASTIRLSLAYETAPFAGFTGFVEVEGVYALGEKENYRIPNHPTQGNKARAIIADPRGTELNQAVLKWKAEDGLLQLVAGREAYALNNGRFISFSGWRQNNQTIDLLRGAVKLGPVTAHYAHLTRVHRVVGPDATDGRLGMSSHVVHFDYARPGIVQASLYGLWLDYDRVNQATNDTRSLGLRLTGPYKLNDDWSVVYTADYAQQVGFADNPVDVSLDYWTLELGAGYRGHRVFGGWTVLEGKRGATFRTPLAHPFNGWVEKFLNTPANGLEARYLSATGPVPRVKGLTYTATYYNYHAATGGARYGSEIDAALEWRAAPVHPNLTLGWRFGRYSADTLFTDSLRTSVYAVLRF